MSLEQLLFLVLLLAIPLLQQLMTAMRGRTDASGPVGPAPAAAQQIPPGQPVVSADTGHEASTGSNAAPLVSAPLPEGVAADVRTMAVRAAHASQPARRRAIPNAIRASATRRRAAFSAEDLRIAFMHVAILGPCRALEPRDASQEA